MKYVICNNDEIISQRYCFGLYPPPAADVRSAFCRAAADVLQKAGHDVDYNDSYGKWRGGKYSGYNMIAGCDSQIVLDAIAAGDAAVAQYVELYSQA